MCITGEMIAIICSTLVSIIAVCLASYFNHIMLRQQRHEEERKRIQDTLHNLYGPIKQYLDKSKALYTKLTFGKPSGFRTVEALANGYSFTHNDRVLIGEIIKIGEKIEAIIITKGGLIDDDDLRDTFYPRFTMHTTILKLLSEGVLVGEPERFDDDLFPRGLNEKTEKRIDALKARLVAIGA